MSTGNHLNKGTEQSEGVLVQTPLLPCVCGHVKKQHMIGIMTGKPMCGKCGVFDLSSRFYHDFKLDNLSLIEQLALKRGLI